MQPSNSRKKLYACNAFCSAQLSFPAVAQPALDDYMDFKEAALLGRPLLCFISETGKGYAAAVRQRWNPQNGNGGNGGKAGAAAAKDEEYDRGTLHLFQASLGVPILFKMLCKQDKDMGIQL